MRRRAFLSLLLAAPLAGCGRQATLPALPAGASVLAFGDSVTYGTGAAPGEDWPTRLAALSGWRIVNAGVPGDTAANGRQRLAGLLDEHRPALVIVEIGGNDFLKRRAPAAVKEDLRAMIAAARATGAQVVLVAVPELSLLGAVTRKPSDAPLYAELGKEEKVPVIEDVFADTLGDPALRADAIHPNARGYARMAAEFDSALRKFGLRG